MDQQTPFYITTPIYYVNDAPHVGHCYTTIVADSIARFMRAAGHDVFFLTGTDEHGQKVEKSAAAKNRTPQQLADENAAHFVNALAYIGATNDDFIRTTQPRHKQQVQAVLKTLIDSGDFYLDTFEGWYDEGQEEYVTENQARERDYKAFNGQPLAKATEENYFFRLSKYWDRVREHIEANPDFIRPDARRNEVLGRLKDDPRDVPISRTNFSWGIPVPGAEKHVTYVWVDALFNYMTALGLIDHDVAGLDASRTHYWSGQGPVVHMIGKEILWFHTVIWPALIMALREAGRTDLILPDAVYAHSFWIREGQKMSKTLGNFIDLPTIEAYCETYSRDAFRWYMLTQGPLGATDADFSHARFIEIYNADLANGFGNAASRVTNMINKYFDGDCPDDRNQTTHAGYDWPAITHQIVATATGQMERLDVAGAFRTALELSNRVDLYINDTTPFKLAKNPDNLPEVGVILYHCIEALRIAATLLHAAIPDATAEFLRRVGVNPAHINADQLTWGAIKPGDNIVKGDGLFPRADPDDPAPVAVERAP